MSKKRYVYTIDDDCFVAKDPSGASINALEQHIRNLLTPSTPLFFNTLYDPFAEGADFVRGYPFSWRQGAPTAVSHGEPLACAAPHVILLPACISTNVCMLGAAQRVCLAEECRISCTARAGLWLNIPDYDAPTQMVKPHERNTRYVDAVMTIPKARSSPRTTLLGHGTGCMHCLSQHACSALAAAASACAGV